jgi:hypothetical protein
MASARCISMRRLDGRSTPLLTGWIGVPERNAMSSRIRVFISIPGRQSVSRQAWLLSDRMGPLSLAAFEASACRRRPTLWTDVRTAARRLANSRIGGRRRGRGAVCVIFTVGSVGGRWQSISVSVRARDGRGEPGRPNGAFGLSGVGGPAPSDLCYRWLDFFRCKDEFCSLSRP